MKRFRTKSYNKRSIVESVISAIKRTTGGFVTATKQDNQQKQVILKVLTYNLERLSRNKKIISFTILIC
jgi:transposase